MAITEHPLTGVTLNEIDIRRKTLSSEEAVTAFLLRLQGDTYTDVVHKLGTNANRIGEVFRGSVHPEARDKAVNLLRKNKLLMI
ncbi:hypothetical protein [Pseudooceanicola nitratireducens]|jgi:hypothetical protein|uniref:hypothetical protein n=1 Tax=Pseudooceanicola nitratireducens TaxID=517719 RepID=UPI003C79ACB1